MSHLGRPDGQFVQSMSLAPVATELSKHLGKTVTFIPQCVGSDVPVVIQKIIDSRTDPCPIVLLENLRFHLEEEMSVKIDGAKKTATQEQIDLFRSQLTQLGDVFVNDAFGTMHRPHSSIVGIKLPRVAGLLVEKELKFFGEIMEKGKIGCAILGGAKVSDKILLIENLLERIENLVIGGGMAFTFLKVRNGMHIGKSLFDENGSKLISKIMDKAHQFNVKIHLPTDFVTASKYAADADVGSATVSSGIPNDYMGLDIGPQTSKDFYNVVTSCSSVIWNGPMGVFEMTPFENGTRTILKAMEAVTKNGGVAVVGGGDSAAAVAKWDGEDRVSHVSTGGGASLELLEGKMLPGIEALDTK